jgi:hypothetical protein
VLAGMGASTLHGIAHNRFVERGIGLNLLPPGKRSVRAGKDFLANLVTASGSFVQRLACPWQRARAHN